MNKAEADEFLARHRDSLRPRKEAIQNRLEKHLVFCDWGPDSNYVTRDSFFPAYAESEIFHIFSPHNKNDEMLFVCEKKGAVETDLIKELAKIVLVHGFIPSSNWIIKPFNKDDEVKLHPLFLCILLMTPEDALVSVAMPLSVLINPKKSHLGNLGAVVKKAS
jgi:hypothetical protein